MGTQGSPVKSYDYLLKFLLVGDSDVGKGEILDSLQDGSAESPYAYSSGELVNNIPHIFTQNASNTSFSQNDLGSRLSLTVSHSENSLVVLTGLPSNMVNIIFVFMVSHSVGAILLCH